MTNNHNGGYLSADKLAGTVFDIFMAGIETTSSTLAWTMVYMIFYPDVQKKVQQELDEVLGQDDPGISLRSKYG